MFKEHKMATDYADQLEWETNLAIDYAISAVDQANWSVLDSIDARAKASATKA
jgi:hypothetical protein